MDANEFRIAVKDIYARHLAIIADVAAPKLDLVRRRLAREAKYNPN